MGTGKGRSVTALGANEIADRAAWFVSRVDSGACGDKRTARRFEISESMARLLRLGRGWTLPRIEQARRIFGPDFDHMVFGPLTGQGVPFDATRELNDLEAAVARFKRFVATGPLRLGDVGVAPRGPLDAERPAFAVAPLGGDPCRREPGERAQAPADVVKRAAE